MSSKLKTRPDSNKKVNVHTVPRGIAINKIETVVFKLKVKPRIN